MACERQTEGAKEEGGKSSKADLAREETSTAVTAEVTARLW